MESRARASLQAEKQFNADIQEFMGKLSAVSETDVAAVFAAAETTEKLEEKN